MRKLLAWVAVGTFALLGVSASAAPVNTTATITVDLGAAGTFAITGTGTVSITGGAGPFSGGGVTGSQIIVPDSLVTVAAEQVIPVPPSASTLIDNVILRTNLRNGAGTFSVGGAAVGTVCPGGNPGLGIACVSGGGAGGIMPLLGDVAISAVGQTGDIALDALNVGAGGGGQAVIDLGIIALTADSNAAPWTTQAAFIGTSNGTVTAGGSPNDPITFVTPTFVDAGGLIELPALARLSLSGIQATGAMPPPPVPEPGALLLLGAGVAGLALVGRGRRR